MRRSTRHGTARDAPSTCRKRNATRGRADANDRMRSVAKLPCSSSSSVRSPSITARANNPLVKSRSASSRRQVLSRLPTRPMHCACHIASRSKPTSAAGKSGLHIKSSVEKLIIIMLCEVLPDRVTGHVRPDTAGCCLQVRVAIVLKNCNRSNPRAPARRVHSTVNWRSALDIPTRRGASPPRAAWQQRSILAASGSLPNMSSPTALPIAGHRHADRRRRPAGRTVRSTITSYRIHARRSAGATPGSVVSAAPCTHHFPQI